MDYLKEIKHQIQESSQVKTDMVISNSSDINKAAEIMIKAVKENRKIFWCGNGGSAADAQHLSTELLGGLRSHDRPPIASIALTTDSSFLTAWSNDTDFNSVFNRQLQGLGHSGDVLIGISTSGNSENVIQAIDKAREMEIHIILFTGHSGGKMAKLGDVNIQIPSADTQRIQEGHILTGHILCDLVEQSVID